MEMNELPQKSRLDVEFTPLSHRQVNRKISSIHRLLRLVFILLIILVILMVANQFGLTTSNLSTWYSNASSSIVQFFSTVENNDDELIKNTEIAKTINEETYGIDVSEWQESIDWQHVASDSTPHHINFAIIKATQSSDQVDKFFLSNWEESKKAGLIRGAYHFYDFSVDPIWQAQNYINIVTLNDTDLPPIIDIETMSTNLDNSNSGRQKAIVDLEIMLKTLEQHYKKLPIVYTNEYFYNTYFKGFLIRYPFWMAKYSQEQPANFGNTTTLPNTPRIAIWQFSDSGNVAGINGNVDLSVIPPSSWTMIQITD